MISEMQIKDRININYPSKGFEHLVLFHKQVEQKDEKGRDEKDSFSRRVQIIYFGKKELLHRYQVFLLETTLELESKLDGYNTLFTRMSYVFDECLIGVNEQGVITEIYNADFIRYQWMIRRAKFLDEYQGEVFMSHIIKMDNLVKDNHSILNHLRSFSMYGLYFNGCRLSYEDKKIEQVKVDYQEDDFKITVDEKIACHLLKSTDQYVRIGVEDFKIIEVQEIRQNERADDLASTSVSNFFCKGEYYYLDGLLEHCKKEININSKKIIYSAKWVGLKKIAQ
jgi:hypothetical protein